VLALEGRNALARVALAASELIQSELGPSARDRLAVIREAVDRLDGVLDKIERLSDPFRGDTTDARTSLAAVWPSLVERIRPTLNARGIVVEATGRLSDRPIAMPAAGLERLLLSLLRVVLAARGSGEAEGDAGPTVLSIECLEDEESIAFFVAAPDSRGAGRLEIDRGDRIELEVALAESRGELLDQTAAAPSRIGLRLRRGPNHA
jgi:hypothetical protein